MILFFFTAAANLALRVSASFSTCLTLSEEKYNFIQHLMKGFVILKAGDLFGNLVEIIGVENLFQLFAGLTDPLLVNITRSTVQPAVSSKFCGVYSRSSGSRGEPGGCVNAS